ncbi:MAG: HipA domain-containing protein [Acidithiobacillus sp.]|nr:HipA domain-containing protein [Acidithiobacillus sp.]
MSQETDLEIFVNGRWVSAGVLRWNRGVCDLEMDRAFFDGGLGAPPVVSLSLPEKQDHFSWKDAQARTAVIPPFLYDLLPQGQARDHLIRTLHVEHRDDRADLPILLHGAANPIGRLRLKTAVDYWQPALDDARTQADQWAFTQDQVTMRDERFVEAMHAFGFIAAGSGSLQGAAPKFLLAINRDGLFVPDMLLADADVTKHVLVKYPRDPRGIDQDILRHEAMFLNVAAQIGLRAGDEPVQWEQDTLIFKRFDREISGSLVIRLHQESLLSAGGIPGFGQMVDHEYFIQVINNKATDPQKEIAEYIKRDMLNIVLGNTDNHGRNTALQITQGGDVRLCPVFDIAPMFMDASAIPRQTRWQADKENSGVVRWGRVVDALPDTINQDAVTKAITDFMEKLASVPILLKEMDANERALERVRRGLRLIMDGRASPKRDLMHGLRHARESVLATNQAMTKLQGHIDFVRMDKRFPVDVPKNPAERDAHTQRVLEVLDERVQKMGVQLEKTCAVIADLPDAERLPTLLSLRKRMSDIHGNLGTLPSPQGRGTIADKAVQYIKSIAVATNTTSDALPKASSLRVATSVIVKKPGP